MPPCAHEICTAESVSIRIGKKHQGYKKLSGRETWLRVTYDRKKFVWNPKRDIWQPWSVPFIHRFNRGTASATHHPLLNRPVPPCVHDGYNALLMPFSPIWRQLNWVVRWREAADEGPTIIQPLGIECQLSDNAVALHPPPPLASTPLSLVICSVLAHTSWLIHLW